MKTTNLLTVTQAAEMLGVTNSRVCFLIAEGRIEATRFGPRVLMVDPASLKRFAKLSRPSGVRRKKKE